MKIEKYLIYKKETNQIECRTCGGQGMGNVTGLTSIHNLNGATFFNSLEEARRELDRKEAYYTENKSLFEQRRAELYWYDMGETKPKDLSILKLTVEEIS
jgi:hypothetical protein